MTAHPELKASRRRLWQTWLWLLVLGTAEFGAAWLPLARDLRPLLMIPAAAMAVIVAIGFMDVRKGPAIVRAFAVGALFWLLILLALGSVDPLTRTDYPIKGSPTVE